MSLSQEEAALFYKLMVGLHWYVCQQLDLYPQINSPEAYRQLDQPAKLAVRNELYNQPEFIDTFVTDNPSRLPDGALAIVHGWKNFVAGDFYIERFLTPYSIWIAAAPPANVYAVYGIAQPIEAIIERVYLPQRVNSVLLPFQDKIIYDGFLSTYPTRLGGPLNATLREEYITAKAQGRLIERLEPTSPSALPAC